MEIDNQLSASTILIEGLKSDGDEEQAISGPRSGVFLHVTEH